MDLSERLELLGAHLLKEKVADLEEQVAALRMANGALRAEIEALRALPRALPRALQPTWPELTFQQSATGSSSLGSLSFAAPGTLRDTTY